MFFTFGLLKKSFFPDVLVFEVIKVIEVHLRLEGNFDARCGGYRGQVCSELDDRLRGKYQVGDEGGLAFLGENIVILNAGEVTHLLPHVLYVQGVHLFIRMLQHAGPELLQTL